MRRRFSPKERVELVDRDGHVLGELVSLTIELGEGEQGGGAQFVPPPEKEKTATPLPPEIEEVWAHYVAVLKAERQDLNAVRIRIIRAALKVRSVAECMRAIDGLRVSPHHNGQNDQRQKYLDIRYALKGNSARGESTTSASTRWVNSLRPHGLSPNLPRKVAIRLDNYQRYIASGRTREGAPEPGVEGRA
jgi:hypothetical protein